MPIHTLNLHLVILTLLALGACHPARDPRVDVDPGFIAARQAFECVGPLDLGALREVQVAVPSPYERYFALPSGFVLYGLPAKALRAGRASSLASIRANWDEVAAAIRRRYPTATVVRAPGDQPGERTVTLPDAVAAPGAHFTLLNEGHDAGIRCVW